MQTLDDLLASGIAGRTVLVRADLNVPMDGSTITDDGRIRASLPTLQALTGAGAKVVVTAHLGRPDGTPNPKYSLAAGRRPAGRTARGAGRGGHRPGRRLRRADGRRARRRPGRAAGERPVRPAGDQQGRRRARRVGRRPGRRGRRGRGLRLRRVRRGAPQAGQRVRRGPAAAALRRLSGVRGDRGAQAADRRPGAALRGDARRVQGLRQARRHHLAAAPGRHPADRRRDGLHVPGGQGLRGGGVAAAGRPDPDLRGPVGRPIPTPSCCRPTWSSSDRVRRRRQRQDRAGRRHRGRLDGRGHRPGHPGGVRRGAGRCGDRVLERPGRGLRDGAVRRWHQGGRRGDRRRRRRSPWSAVATRPPRCARSASTRPVSPTSRPAAARRWNSWRAKTFPASPFWRTDAPWPPPHAGRSSPATGR